MTKSSKPFMDFSEGDEPPMTACGGNIIGCEIIRNKQCPHEADLRRLRMRTWGKPLFGLQRAVSTRKHPSYGVPSSRSARFRAARIT